MIEITRKLARQLRTVLRRTLGTHGAPVVFNSGPEGICIQAQGHSAAVEYHIPGDHPPQRIAVPFEFLADCEGRKDEPVTLELEKNRVVASWRDGSIPQLVQYESPKLSKAGFPQHPPSMTNNEPRLLAALRDAVDTTDQDTTRYALGCVQLRGSGQVVATDGRQLLMQSGYEFPWDDDLLVPGSKVFGCRELPGDEPIGIGSTVDWVSIRVGPWTIHLKMEKNARFPRTDDLMRDPKDASTRWQLSPADADFLVESLKRLPADSNGHLSVTVDLNGQATIRAQAENQPHPTELLLRGSRLSGQAIRYITDRQYLARALRLGFRDVCLFNPEAAVVCHDEHRQYLWMPLSGAEAIGPSKDAIRIESPGDPVAAPNPNRKENGSSAAEQLAAEFTNRLQPWSVCSYLLGLSAMASGRVEAAHGHFSSAVEEQPTWIAPWLGWATAAYQQGRWDEICENHPHLDGVELLPFDAGDEGTFLELAEDEREGLSERFSQAATSLGNYLAIAQLCRSKEQIATSRMEFKKVA